MPQIGRNLWPYINIYHQNHQSHHHPRARSRFIGRLRGLPNDGTAARTKYSVSWRNTEGETDSWISGRLGVVTRESTLYPGFILRCWQRSNMIVGSDMRTFACFCPFSEGFQLF